MEHKDHVKRKYLKAKEEYENLQKEIDQIAEKDGEVAKFTNCEVAKYDDGCEIYNGNFIIEIEKVELPRLVKFLTIVAAKNGIKIS